MIVACGALRRRPASRFWSSSSVSSKSLKINQTLENNDIVLRSNTLNSNFLYFRTFGLRGCLEAAGIQMSSTANILVVEA